MHVFLEPLWQVNAQDFGYLIALGLGPMGIAFYAWDKALKQGDPRVIGALSYLTPLLSTLLLLLVSGRKFEAHLLIAICLIIGGAFICSYFGNKLKKNQQI